MRKRNRADQAAEKKPNVTGSAVRKIITGVTGFARAQLAQVATGMRIRAEQLSGRYEQPDFNILQKRLTEIMLEAVIAKANHAAEERKRRLSRGGAKVDAETIAEIADDELRLLAVKFIRAGVSFHSIQKIVDRAIGRGRKTATELFQSVGKAASAARKKVKPLISSKADFELLCYWDGTIGDLPNKLPSLNRWSIPAVHKYFTELKIDPHPGSYVRRRLNTVRPIELDAFRKRYARLGLRPIQPFLVNLAQAKAILADPKLKQACFTAHHPGSPKMSDKKTT